MDQIGVSFALMLPRDGDHAHRPWSLVRSTVAHVGEEHVGDMLGGMEVLPAGLRVVQSHECIGGRGRLTRRDNVWVPAMRDARPGSRVRRETLFERKVSQINGLEQWDHGEQGENRLIGTSIYSTDPYTGPGTGIESMGAAKVLPQVGYSRSTTTAPRTFAFKTSAIRSIFGGERQTPRVLETAGSMAAKIPSTPMPKTWASNKKLLFTSDVSELGTTNLSIVDDGVTLSFRARLSTAAADPDAPLDPLYPTQDGYAAIQGYDFGDPGPHDWPEAPFQNTSNLQQPSKTPLVALPRATNSRSPQPAC